MTSENLSPELAGQIALEQRAHETRLAMWRNAAFIASIKAGMEAEEAGDMVSVAELDQQLRLD